MQALVPARPALKLSLVLAAALIAAVAWSAYRISTRPPIDEIAVPAVACTPLDAGQGRVFHVDPVSGSDDGDGSSARPWRSLQYLVDNDMISRQRRDLGRIERLVAAVLHRPPQRRLRDQPGAIVVGGDTILLAAGDHGAVDLSDLANRKFVTIAAAPGAAARLSSLKLGGASHFILRGITVQPTDQPTDQPADQPTERIFVVEAYGAHAVSRGDNIHFDSVEIAGSVPIAATSAEKFSRIAPSGMLVRGDCVSLVDSKVHDVRDAVAFIRVRDATISDNRITDFSVDGIDFSGAVVAIRRNLITDHWRTGDHFHPDCMHGQTPADGRFGPVLIEGNACVARTQGAFDPAAAWQGISIFDGHWRDITVRCNLVIPNAGHGIALYGVDEAFVEHNTVIGNPRGPLSWIAIMPAKTGRQSSGVVVRENRATAYLNAVQGGPLPLSQMLDVVRANRQDDELMDALSQPVEGVELVGNTWLTQAGESARQIDDARFAKQKMTALTLPLSVADAYERYPLPEACGDLAPAF